MKWHHVGIEVRNLVTSIQFYKDKFGFEIEQYLTLPGEKIAFITKELLRVELIESNEKPRPDRSIHLAWQVDEIEDWMKKLGEPIEGPYKLKNGWITVFYKGPDKEVIELIQINKE